MVDKKFRNTVTGNEMTASELGREFCLECHESGEEGNRTSHPDQMEKDELIQIGIDIVNEDDEWEEVEPDVPTMTMVECFKHIDQNFGQTFINLYCRWQSEKEYEDFNEYVSVFKSKIPFVIKGTKRPFGIHVQCTDGIMHVVVVAKGKYLNLEGRVV